MGRGAGELVGLEYGRAGVQRRAGLGLGLWLVEQAVRTEERLTFGLIETESELQ